MDDKVHYELQQLDIFSVDKLELCKFVPNRRIYCWILNFRSQLTNRGRMQIVRLPVIHCTSLFKKEVILLKFKSLYYYIMAIKEINLISTPHLPPTINNNNKNAHTQYLPLHRRGYCDTIFLIHPDDNSYGKYQKYTRNPHNKTVLL